MPNETDKAQNTPLAETKRTALQREQNDKYEVIDDVVIVEVRRNQHFRYAATSTPKEARGIARKLNHHDQMLSLLHRLLTLFPNPTADSVAGELVGDVRELLKEIDQ